MAASSVMGLGKQSIATPIHLYRYLLRECKKIPNKDAQVYYTHFIRQGFNSHSDETDPERIQQIISRAIQDCEWIIKKYTKPKG